MIVSLDISTRLVRDEMTKIVVTAVLTDSAQRVISLMKEYRITALPVLDDEGQCVGVFTASDLVKDEVSRYTVGELMSTRLATAAPEMPIVEAAGAMLRNRVHHLPVVDEEQRLVGIVASMDLLAAFYKSQAD